MLHAPPPGSGKATVYLVGTIHSEHLNRCDYPMTELEKALAHTDPQLVLVEIRPEPFARGELYDGPLEMTYATHAALRRGIRVEPFDYWTEEMIAVDPPVLDEARQAAFDEAMSAVQPKVEPGSFAFVQSTAFEQSVRRDRAIREEFGTDPFWRPRQQEMNRLAVQAIEPHARGRNDLRVVVFVGAMHVPETMDALIEAGHRVEVYRPNFTMELSEDRWIEERFPPEETLASWQSASPMLRQRTLEDKAMSFDRAVRNRGRCGE